MEAKRKNPLIATQNIFVWYIMDSALCPNEGYAINAEHVGCFHFS